MPGAQLENGYTRIANELLDALTALDLSGLQLRCVLLVVRLSYGYNRKEARISRWKFAKATGSAERNVARALDRLVEINVLHRLETPGRGSGRRENRWRLNKDPATWSRPPSRETQRDAPSWGQDPEPEGNHGDASPPGSEFEVPETPEASYDDLTRQLIDEGYSGLRLVQEHRRRGGERGGQTVQNADPGENGERGGLQTPPSDLESERGGQMTPPFDPKNANGGAKRPPHRSTGGPNDPPQRGGQMTPPLSKEIKKDLSRARAPAREDDPGDPGRRKDSTSDRRDPGKTVSADDSDPTLKHASDVAARALGQMNGRGAGPPKWGQYPDAAVISAAELLRVGTRGKATTVLYSELAAAFKATDRATQTAVWARLDGGDSA